MVFSVHFTGDKGVVGSNPAAPTIFGFSCFFESVVTSSEGACLSEDLKNGTPRGSLAFAFIKKMHWWYGIVWLGLASWVVVRWGFEGY